MQAVYIFFFATIWCLCLCTGRLQAQELFWQLRDQDGRQVVAVRSAPAGAGLPADSLLVFVGQKQHWPAAYPSIIGKVVRLEDGLYFQPDLPFRAGLTYTAFLGRYARFSFSLPVEGPRPEVTAFYPSGMTVPANLLKIYIHFSEPMGEGRAYDHLSLVSAGGDTIYQPFVPLQPELWSEDRRRLTLWLDPGRVKRGLLSRQAHGPVLEEGRRYVLSIHGAWKSAAGMALGKNYEKAFTAGPPDDRQPGTAGWTIRPPAPGSRQPLVITFGEPLDHALATRQIQVRRNGGAAVPGTVALSGAESVWEFLPDEPWPAGAYTIVVDPGLEDLAGNSLNRPFDHDLAGQHGDDQKPAGEFVRLNLIIEEK